MKKTLGLGMGMALAMGLWASMARADVSAPIGINFDTAQAQFNVDQDLEVRFQAAAREMENYPFARMEVEGYTDSVGSDANNQKLSADRADNVKRYLISKYGIEPNRIIIRSLGESGAAATNSTNAGREENRRVVVRVYR